MSWKSYGCYLCGKKQSTGSAVSMHQFPKEEQVRAAWFQACGLFEGVDDVTTVRICSNHFSCDDYIEPRAKLFGGRLILRNTAVPSLVPSKLAPQYEQSSILLDHSYSSIGYVKDDCGKNLDLAFTAPVNLPTVDDASPVLVTSLAEVEQAQDVINSPLTEETVAANSKSAQEIEQPSTLEHTAKRRFFEPRFISEIETIDMASPEKARRILELVKRTDAKKSQKIKRLQSQNRKLVRHIEYLKEFVRNQKLHYKKA